jgi:integrase
MSPRKRPTLAKGIYRDKSGIAIRVSVRGEPREFRRDENGKSYKGWELSRLLIERKRIDLREHLKAEHTIAKGESLAADADSYLKTLPADRRTKAEGRLAHWLSHLGDRSRRDLTAVELRQHAATWTCAPSTFNHRRQELINLYQTLDPKGENPAREIPKRKEILGAPRALAYSVITALLAKMPECKTRARLKLMAYTGLPQMQITKLTPEDWQGHQLRVSPRRKGAGAAGRTIPISPEAYAAMEEFARLDAWGEFSRPSMRNFWIRYGAPKGTTPYALRHSWITELYRRSNGDVLALQQLALHSRLEQTQRYAAAGLDSRMAALVFATKSLPRPSAKESTVLHKTTYKTARRRPLKNARKR